jgi:hypothetical protein
MIKLSAMSGKLKGITGINTNTLSNPYCMQMSKNPDLICSKCYSISMLQTFRQSCVKPWQHNSDVLSKPMTLKQLKSIKINSKYCRINAHGEFINEPHFINIMNIVTSNPDVFFAIWTKKKVLVKGWLQVHDKPKNCNFIYSNPKLDTEIKHVKAFCKIYGFDKVFNCYSNVIDKVKINCGPKKCIDCKLCYTKNRTININELIR